MEIIIRTHKLEPEKIHTGNYMFCPVRSQNITTPEASSLFLASSVYDKLTFQGEMYR